MELLKFYDREDRPWPNKRLKKAAIVGHTEEESAKIWVRVEKEGSYWLIYSSQKIPTNSKLPSIEKSKRKIQWHLDTEGKDSPQVSFLSQKTAKCFEKSPIVLAETLTSHSRPRRRSD